MPHYPGYPSIHLSNAPNPSHYHHHHHCHCCRRRPSLLPTRARSPLSFSFPPVLGHRASNWPSLARRPRYYIPDSVLSASSSPALALSHVPAAVPSSALAPSPPSLFQLPLPLRFFASTAPSSLLFSRHPASPPPRSPGSAAPARPPRGPATGTPRPLLPRHSARRRQRCRHGACSSTGDSSGADTAAGGPRRRRRSGVCGGVVCAGRLLLGCGPGPDGGIGIGGLSRGRGA